MPLSFQSPNKEHLSGGSRWITFDPLAVATVLPNPRAVASAVRLYTQYHHEDYRWPYLTMLGGTLPPLRALVDHVFYPRKNVHPGTSMALKTVQYLPVKSDTIFTELPLDQSNDWISLDFEQSEQADYNDFMIFCVDEKPKEETDTPKASKRAFNILFTFVNLLNGLLLCLLLVVAILLGDIWAACLFVIYILHWLASTSISYTQLVGYTQNTPKIKPNATPRYALYRRKAPEAGTIIFKGRHDQIEAWARRTWNFYAHTPRNHALHWCWIVSGTGAALASTAAMVNMSGALQLAFLGLLLYGSVLDNVLGRLSQRVSRARVERDSVWLGGNKFRTESIIRATLEPAAHLRLEGLDWVGMGGLPPLQVFVDMQRMLAEINRLQMPSGIDYDGAVAVVARFKAENPKDGLADRIACETIEVLDRIKAAKSVE